MWLVMQRTRHIPAHLIACASALSGLVDLSACDDGGRADQLTESNANTVLAFDAMAQPQEASVREAGAFDAACGAQCYLGACDAQVFAEQPGFDATLTDWSGRCAQTRAETGFAFLVEGRCSDGTRVLKTGTGLSVERRYFNASGAFLGQEVESDFIDPICHGTHYFPVRVPCEESVVVRTICGNMRTVGTAL